MAAEGECSGAKAELAAAKEPCVRRQLATLMTETRISGVMVKGKKLMKKDAYAAVEAALVSTTATRIKAACEESRNCEKTLASNVDKALSSGCILKEFTSLVKAGEIESIVVGDFVLSGDEAIGGLKVLVASNAFWAECGFDMSKKDGATQASSEASCESKAACSTEAAAKSECGTKAASSKECSTEAAAKSECSTEAAATKECCSTEAAAKSECGTKAAATKECSTGAAAKSECSTKASAEAGECSKTKVSN